MTWMDLEDSMSCLLYRGDRLCELKTHLGRTKVNLKILELFIRSPKRD